MSSSPGSRGSPNQLLHKLSWKSVSSIKDKAKREGLIYETIQHFVSMPTSVIIDWTSTIHMELTQYHSMSNIWKNVDRLQYLKVKCHLHSKLIPMMMHGYVIHMNANEELKSLLNVSEVRQLQVLSHKDKRSPDYYPVYAGEILLSMIEHEPESSIDIFIKKMLDKEDFWEVLVHGMKYGLFTLRFCCLKIIRALMIRSLYFRELLQKDIQLLLSSLVGALINILNLDSMYLVEELRTKRGSHQHSILSAHSVLSDRYAIRHTEMLKETSMMILNNTVLLNVYQLDKIIDIEYLVETVLQNASELPHESYPDSDILLASCNILYLLVVNDSFVTGIDETEYPSHITKLFSIAKDFMKHVYKVFKKIKSIVHLDQYIEKKVQKLDTYQRVSSKKVLDEVFEKATDNIIRSETTLLNIVAEITNIDKYARKFARYQNGNIVNLLRLRAGKAMYNDLQMFMLYTTFDGKVILVQPNDYSALTIAMRNIYPHCDDDEVESGIIKLKDFQLDACNFVKQKAMECFKAEQFELACNLFSVILKVLNDSLLLLVSSEDIEDEELENIRISSYGYRSDCLKRLGAYHAAYNDADIAVRLHAKQHDRLKKKLGIISQLASTPLFASSVPDLKVQTPTVSPQSPKQPVIQEQIQKEIEEEGYPVKHSPLPASLNEPSFYDVRQMITSILPGTPDHTSIVQDDEDSKTFIELEYEERKRRAMLEEENNRTPTKQEITIEVEEEDLQNEEEEGHIIQKKQNELALDNIQQEVEDAVERLRKIQEEENERISTEREQLEQLQFIQEQKELREKESQRKREELHRINLELEEQNRLEKLRKQQSQREQEEKQRLEHEQFLQEQETMRRVEEERAYQAEQALVKERSKLEMLKQERDQVRQQQEQELQSLKKLQEEIRHLEQMNIQKHKQNEMLRQQQIEEEEMHRLELQRLRENEKKRVQEERLLHEILEAERIKQEQESEHLRKQKEEEERITLEDQQRIESEIREQEKQKLLEIKLQEEEDRNIHEKEQELLAIEQEKAVVQKQIESAKEEKRRREEMEHLKREQEEGLRREAELKRIQREIEEQRKALQDREDQLRKERELNEQIRKEQESIRLEQEAQQQQLLEEHQRLEAEKQEQQALESQREAERRIIQQEQQQNLKIPELDILIDTAPVESRERTYYSVDLDNSHLRARRKRPPSRISMKPLLETVEHEERRNSIANVPEYKETSNNNKEIDDVDEWLDKQRKIERIKLLGTATNRIPINLFPRRDNVNGK
jgi:L-fucose mutarotase/ribose pyranase (RbsD/FucU family)